MRAQFRSRIRIVLIGILLTTLIIIGRLYTLQIIHGDEYAQKADRQFAAGATGLFDRGSIYFSRKDDTLISAATLVTGFLVAINPQTLRDPERAYAAISAVAPNALSREEFMAAADKKSRIYVEVANHLPDEAGRALAAQALPGVQVLRERWRYYPGGPLAGQTIGVVSFGTGDTLTGSTGVEYKYDATLIRSGNSLYKNFFAQLFSNIGDLLVSAEDTREGDIITTLEPEVQTRLLEDLAKVTRQYASQQTGGIIMDPKTGAIIAMASYPTYDPNDLASADPALLKNPLVQNVYEFGSIMKPLTVTAGIDAGVIAPTSTYHDTGCITLNTRTICNWDRKARGTVPVTQIIVQSLNLGTSWIAGELGQERFRTYFTKLLSEKTGIDLPSEARSLTSNLQSREQINYATASFGQGVAVTPVQMIRALGSIANGGSMVTPHVVRATRTSTGIDRDLDWSATAPVFSTEAARATTEMMVEVVDSKLLEGKAKIPTMSVAAKTGTAQLTDGQGGYHSDRFFHSFVGFFPAYSPRFIVLLYTNDPQGVQYASETLSKTFLDLTHFLIEYYELPPDRGLPEQAAAASPVTV